MSSQQPFVIVVGAGASGLFLSLLLAQKKIPVPLIEKHITLDNQPRATHYAGPALTFRTRENKILGAIDHNSVSDDPNKPICLSLDQLGQILLSHVEKGRSATILWNHEVTDIKDDNGTGVVTATTSAELKELSARYVVGRDGAISKVRRLLFADWEFPGKTWETQIVATDMSIAFSGPALVV